MASVTQDDPARVFEPARPRLADALACVLGIDPSSAAAMARDGAQWDEARGQLHHPRIASAAWARGERTARAWAIGARHATPAAAWEALASNGVIPLAWTDAPDRAFVTADYARARPAPDMTPTVLAQPPTLRSCVTLAASADAMATAEALAREFAARVGEWTGTVHDRIRWRIDLAPTIGIALDSQLERVLRVLDATKAWRTRTDAAGWPVRARLAHEASSAWERRVAADARVGEEPDLPATVRARPLRELRDPFAPLRDLYATGFALDGFDATARAVVLVAREVHAL